MVIDFFVAGDPIPQGSMRAIRPGLMLSDNKRLKPWRRTVAQYAAIAAARARLHEPSAKPCEVHLVFLMPTPAYVAKKIARAGEVGRVVCAMRPDVDKLVRAVFDALTDVVWVDDQQVYLVSARKVYPLPGESPGANVRVTFPEEDR